MQQGRLRPIRQLIEKVPHHFLAIAEDATILGLILIAATFADELTKALLGEHVSPVIEGLLTASLWVMVAIYAVSVLGTMRKLVFEDLLPRPQAGGVIAMAGPKRPSSGRRDSRQQEKMREELPLSVLVVDDDMLVTMAVKHVLAADDRIGTVTTANSPDAAIARIASGPNDEAPDVVLMDINYVGCEKTGIDALDEFREVSPGSKLLIMSVCRDAETVRAAVSNEADGFIWKNESAVDFAEAVVGTAHHGFVTSKSIAHELVDVR
jgi:CheY-like chemotaxis protein